MRNDKQNQTSHYLNVAFNCFWQCLPPVLLALAAVSRLEIAVPLSVGPPIVRSLLSSSYVIFVIATVFIWAALVSMLRVQASSFANVFCIL